MKTLIITDLDYDKKNLSMEEVKAKDSNSTNATINYCYRVAHPDREEKYVPTIKELYDFQVEGKNILYNGLVYLAFQDENSTARTLEEAMLKKILNKVLGDGVVIFPEDGTVMAPCKATVSLVYPTGHAIGLTTADGAEILIHCGVDTVNMNGEGFETLVKEGQEVTAEEALIRFDIDLVKKHGYSPEILVIFTELPEGKTIKTEEKHIAKNDKMAEIV